MLQSGSIRTILKPLKPCSPPPNVPLSYYEQTHSWGGPGRN